MRIGSGSNAPPICFTKNKSSIMSKPSAKQHTAKYDEHTIETPATLMEFLTSTYEGRSRTTVKSYLTHGQVTVGGVVKTKFDTPLTAGDIVRVTFGHVEKPFTHKMLRIVYEDDDLLVVNKGYGLLSIGNDKIREGTAYSIVRDYLKNKDPRNKVFIVHRLDQHTSGLMVFAKNIEAKEGLQHNWNNMVRRRQYVCVVEGKLVPPAGDVKSYLAENSEHVVYSTDNPEEGQFALTRYKTVASANGYTLVEVELETGRKNQIRVHMKDLGHPIAGDRRYGARTSPIHRLALHARTLEFIHPVTRKLLSFSTPVPAPFQSMVK